VSLASGVGSSPALPVGQLEIGIDLTLEAIHERRPGRPRRFDWVALGVETVRRHPRPKPRSTE
jgi:hypothetical protein